MTLLEIWKVVIFSDNRIIFLFSFSTKNWRNPLDNSSKFMGFDDLEELTDGIGWPCSKEGLPIIMFQKFEKSFYHIWVAVFQLTILIMMHHESWNSIEYDAIVGRFIFQGCLEDVVIWENFGILVDHLLAGFPHAVLPLFDMLYLIFKFGTLRVHFILIFIEFFNLLLFLGNALINTLDQTMFLEVSTLEKRVMKDVSLWLRSQLGEVVQVELSQKRGVILVSEVSGEQSGAKSERSVNNKRWRVVPPTD